MQYLAGGLRLFQLLFSIVVLGLSVSLVTGWTSKAKREEYEQTNSIRLPGVPALLEYNSFVGGFGILAAVVGLISFWMELLQGIVTMITDALAALFFLATGIATAVALKGVKCTAANPDDSSNAWSMWYDNKILNRGCRVSKSFKVIDIFVCYYESKYANNRHTVQSRCTSAYADTVFAFLAFAVCLVLIVHTFFWGGRVAGRKSAAV